jgi:hypothetical protein
MKKTVFGLLLAAIFAGAPAQAQTEQRLYRETDEHWFIYVENQSCVAYVDYHNGDIDVTFRLSHRPDVDRMFFTAYGNQFERYREGIGESILLGLGFESSREFLGSVGMIIRQSDGVMGVSGSEFDIAEMFQRMSTKRDVLIRIMPNAAPTSHNARVVNATTDFGPFPLNGSAIAMMHLQECTARNFPRAR